MSRGQPEQREGRLRVSSCQQCVTYVERRINHAKTVSAVTQSTNHEYESLLCYFKLSTYIVCVSIRYTGFLSSCIARFIFQINQSQLPKGEVTSQYFDKSEELTLWLGRCSTTAAVTELTLVPVHYLQGSCSSEIYYHL